MCLEAKKEVAIVLRFCPLLLEGRCCSEGRREQRLGGSDCGAYGIREHPGSPGRDVSEQLDRYIWNSQEIAWLHSHKGLRLFLLLYFLGAMLSIIQKHVLNVHVIMFMYLESVTTDNQNDDPQLPKILRYF